MGDKMYRYKNTSKVPQSLIGYGRAEPGGIIETSEEINNPYFELVQSEPKEDKKFKKKSSK